MLQSAMEHENTAHASDVYGGRPAGFILWLTGMSGAGKSTLAHAVRHALEQVLPVEILDGDEVRTILSRGLGFSKADREENIRRIGYVARVLARHRVAVITAAISPYREAREEVRRLAQAQGIAFIEVHAHASLEALIARDVKGLYKKALAGEISNFTGISDPYEPPEAPDVVVRTDQETVAQGVQNILERLRERGLFTPARTAARSA
jgi:adenylylsulfate kinase